MGGQFHLRAGCSTLLAFEQHSKTTESRRYYIGYIIIPPALRGLRMLFECECCSNANSTSTDPETTTAQVTSMLLKSRSLSAQCSFALFLVGLLYRDAALRSVPRVLVLANLELPEFLRLDILSTELRQQDAPKNMPRCLLACNDPGYAGDGGAFRSRVHRLLRSEAPKFGRRLDLRDACVVRRGCSAAS